MVVHSRCILRMTPRSYPQVLPTIKHEANISMDLNIHRSQGIEGGGFLHLLIKSVRDFTPRRDLRCTYRCKIDSTLEE